MTIERRFEPDSEAVERLVEVLYSLLVEAAGDREERGKPVPLKGQPSPCVTGERE